jgi:hypothetical protein
VRQHDLVRDKAVRHGFNVATAKQGPMSVADFAAGIEAYELYRQVHDRRAEAQHTLDGIRRGLADSLSGGGR